MLDNIRIFSKSTLERFISEKQNPQIAIVGNGPVDDGDRKEIENSSVVIRFNNWSARKVNYKDWCILTTGARCDILFTTMDALQSPKAGDKPAVVVMAIPYPHNCDKTTDRLPSWYPEASWEMINPYLNRLLCKELRLNSIGYQHPLPTAGMTALWHIYRFNLPCTFFVTGFSWMYDETADTIQGVPLNAKELPSNFGHFYIKEALWTARKLRHAERWRFSRTALRTLDRVLSVPVFQWETAT